MAHPSAGASYNLMGYGQQATSQMPGSGVMMWGQNPGMIVQQGPPSSMIAGQPYYGQVCFSSSSFIADRIN